MQSCTVESVARGTMAEDIPKGAAVYLLNGFNRVFKPASIVRHRIFSSDQAALTRDSGELILFWRRVY
jgi:hypothetical protein